MTKQKAELKARAIEDLKRQQAEPKRIRWNQLTRAERNEHRRRQYQVRRALEKKDPVREAERRETLRQRAQAAWRRALAERARSKSPSPTAEQSASNWRRFRNSHSPGPTAEESARGWLEWRRSRTVSDAIPSTTPPSHRLERVRESDETAAKPSPDCERDFGL